MTTLRTILRTPLHIIRDNARAYLLLNLMAYGIMLIGVGVGLLYPNVTEAQNATLQDDGTVDQVTSLLSRPWLFALFILLVNVFRLSLVTIVLPSTIVPFAGVALFAYWTFTMGLTFAPSDATGWVALIPHSLTIVIEFQAYILVALGAFLVGRNWLRPRAIGASTRRQGYVRGLQQLGWLSLPGFVLLVVGAIYEAFSLVYLVHPLLEWLL